MKARENVSGAPKTALEGDGETQAIVLVRHFEATPEDVWCAWTDPARLAWFLNPEQPTPDEPIEVDLRVGGFWRIVMAESAEKRYVTGGRYLQVEEPTRLVYAWGAIGGWPDLGPEGDRIDEVPTITVLIEPVEHTSRTRQTATLSFPAAMADDTVAHWLSLGVRAGWEQTIGRMRLS